ncbi:MAG: methyltransferase domain-containing protein [Microthrixaceae bacterium]
MDLICPQCRSVLSDELSCSGCGRVFGQAGEVPILLPEDSVFNADQVVDRRGYFQSGSSDSRLKVRLRRSLPSIAGDSSIGIEDEYLATTNGSGLIIGAGSRRTHQMQYPAIDWLVTDVDLTHGVDMIVDATALPFADGEFNVVIADHVIEHVFDMQAAAAEIQRVCAVTGTIVIRVPFCHPWHGQPYDFFRCTPTGLRALFRDCDVLELCAGQGSASAVASMTNRLVVDLSGGRWTRRALNALSRILLSGLKLLDKRRTTVQIGSAGSLTLVGRKSTHRRSPAEVIEEVKLLTER